MTQRQDTLRRIREALRSSEAPDPRRPRLAGLESDPGPVFEPIAPGELVGRFEQEFERVGGAAHRVSSIEELRDAVSSILHASDLDASSRASVVLSRNPLLHRLGLAGLLGSLTDKDGPAMRVAAWPVRMPPSSATSGEASSRDPATYRKECFSAAVGITGVDFALAETGTLVLSSSSEGSQLSSLAPPVHVALYTPNQVVGSLEEVLDGIAVSPLSGDNPGPAPGRSVVFITGPSSTADIEQILVRGVHGPREVHAILVQEPCLA